MTDEALIINGSYKDIPIYIASGGLEGGRKVSVKQYPNKDTQSVEDLGLMPRKYSLDIIVSRKLEPAQDYFTYRDSLIAALEKKGGGVLIHPLYGRIENVVAVTYSLNESFDSFGYTTISVNFEINRNTGIPKISNNALTQVAAANDILQSAVNNNIAEAFKVTTSFTGNFTAAVDKVNSVIESVQDSISFVGDAADTINSFTNQIGEVIENVNSLVTKPRELANAITELFESANGLYAATGATFETMIGFFDFGDNDIEIKPTTAGRIERKKNNDTLNAAIAASSLGYAYLAASSITFETTRQIDDVAARLDEQYQKVITSDADQATKNAVTDMRVKVLDVLDDVRVNTSKIISIETVNTSARLLGFTYYGDDSNGAAIAALNNISDVSFVSGEVEVLTA